MKLHVFASGFNSPENQIDELESLEFQSSNPSDAQSDRSASPSKPLTSLAQNWAKKYYSSVKTQSSASTPPQQSNETTEEVCRSRTVHKLTSTLKLTCELAWNQVESLFQEDYGYVLHQNGINPDQIQAQTYKIYAQMLEAYAEYETPARLSVLVGRQIRALRQKYTQIHPLLLGFVAMQFHYFSQALLGCVPPQERTEFMPYLNTLDDYVSLPIADIHELAGLHNPQSPALSTVQHLLQLTTAIASSVQKATYQKNPQHRTKSGSLADPLIKLSSTRDIEVFLYYLGICVLEGSVRPLQQELFPLCVMLYPKLQISWKLVQDMLVAMFWQLRDQLEADEMMLILPYIRTLGEMFSDEVFCA